MSKQEGAKHLKFRPLFPFQPTANNTMTDSNLKKETIRFYAEDADLIREFYPGGYGKPGINEVIREVIHSWVNTNIRAKLSSATPNVNTDERKPESTTQL